MNAPPSTEALARHNQEHWMRLATMPLCSPLSGSDMRGWFRAQAIIGGYKRAIQLIEDNGLGNHSKESNLFLQQQKSQEEEQRQLFCPKCSRPYNYVPGEGMCRVRTKKGRKQHGRHKNGKKLTIFCPYCENFDVILLKTKQRERRRINRGVDTKFKNRNTVIPSTKQDIVVKNSSISARNKKSNSHKNDNNNTQKNTIKHSTSIPSLGRSKLPSALQPPSMKRTPISLQNTRNAPLSFESLLGQL